MTKQRQIEIAQGIIDLAPEMFASSDLKVINYKGNNYYRACGEHVFESKEDGSRSSCVKPAGHIYWEHEDAWGRTLDPSFGVMEMNAKVRNDLTRVLRRTGLDEGEIFNTLNAIECSGYKISLEDNSGG